MFLIAMMLSPALAQETPEIEVVDVAEREPAEPAMDIEDGHIEYGFGFMVGQSDFAGSAWSPIDAQGNAQIGAFSRHPFEEVTVSGFHIDQRLVWNQLRVGIGYQRGFPSYSFQEATRKDTSVQYFAEHQLRLAIGAIAPSTPVAPYMDLAGDVTELRSVIAVGNKQERYRSTDFGLALVGGVRAQTGEHTFLAIQGEYGLTGAESWGVQATVGFNVF